MPPQQATTSLPTMAKQSTPKTMSSRLMTMKFMQRGAAAAAASAAASPSIPKTEDEGAASKRRKTQHTTPGTPTTPLFDEYQAIRVALDDEERKRLVAVEKRAAELGDAHWVLDGARARANNKASASRVPLKIVQVGYAQIDYSGTRDDDDNNGTVDISTKARFQYNMKSKTPTKEQPKDDDDNSDDSDSDSDSASGSDSEEGEVSPDSKAATPRGRHHHTDDIPPSRKRTRSILRNDERQKKSRELAAARRKKEVNLNQLTSISGASVQQHKAGASSFACHRCGKPGHKIAECPQGGGNGKRQKR
ncbi:hypothetical protein B0T18DRAFT_434005 [Schizothecium vesticola]|uniref:CCHC-type domain-containing protein n=1 Tax=Schizothecium vesticola TaxID=314040 RepID=A0AA40KBJ9_9PEZI|nr:hypothetical protein B0T18DRAFT_434005 [Schizothecium vesticola]